MSSFSTTDMYLAAYMNMYAIEMNTSRVGGKVVFKFNFSNETSAEDLYDNYLKDLTTQAFVTNIKNIRGEVYRLMKQ